jgi:hypothetical protein
MPRNKTTDSPKPAPRAKQRAKAAGTKTKKAPADFQPREVAMRLHNTACQTVTGVRMMASVLRRRLPADAAGASAMLQDMDEELIRLSDELRALVRELRGK